MAPRPASPRSIRQLHRRRRTAIPKIGGSSTLLLSAPRAAAAPPRQRIRRERGRLSTQPLCATARRSGNRPRSSVAPRPASPRSILQLHRRRRTAIPKIGGSSTPLLSAPRAAAAPPRQRIRRERGRLSTQPLCATARRSGNRPRSSVAPRPASPRSILQLHRRRRTAIPKIGGSSTPLLSAPRAAAAPPRQRIRRERGRLSTQPLCATARRSGNRPRSSVAPRPASPRSIRQLHRRRRTAIPKIGGSSTPLLSAPRAAAAPPRQRIRRERGRLSIKPLCATARRSGNRPRSSVAPRPASPRSIRQLHRRRRTAIPKIGGSSTLLLSAPRAAAAPPRQRIRRERGRLSTNRCAQQPGDQGIDPRSSVAPRPASPRSIRQLHRRRRTAIPKIGGSSTPLLSAPRAAAAPPRQRIRRERGRLSTQTAVRNSPAIRESTPVARWPLAPPARGPSSSSIAAGAPQFPKSAAAPHLCCRRRVPLPRHHVNGYGEREDA